MLQDKSRPTSPHLTIYRPQITSVLSMFHRISGVVIFFALSFVVWWFIFAVFSDFSPFILNLFKYKIIKIPFCLSSLAIFYHLCSGIRHLMFDIGLGFDIKSITSSGQIAVVCFLLITIIFWIFVV